MRLDFIGRFVYISQVILAIILTVVFVCVQEQPLGGPRIKHVCRAAAVALGQPRAMVPDDIPRLSALPLHEREGITFSPAAEGTVLLHVLFLSRMQKLTSFFPSYLREE